jgi:predicted negative regulator of RcsB-dependent stress response
MLQDEPMPPEASIFEFLPEGVSVAAVIAVIVLGLRYLSNRERQHMEAATQYQSAIRQLADDSHARMKDIHEMDEKARDGMSAMFERSLGRVVESQQSMNAQLVDRMSAIVESNNRVDSKLSQVLERLNKD